MSKVDELLKDLQHNTINFTVPLLSDPKKEVVFRPIKTKDQKTLAIMRDEVKDIENSELENFKAVIKLLDMVVIKCPVTFKQLEIPDFIWMLINIRAKSIGEVIELVSKCHSCGHAIEFNLDVFKDVEKVEKKGVTESDMVVKFTDNITVTFGILTLEDLLNIMAYTNKERDSVSAASMIKKVEFEQEVLDVTLDTKVKMVDELSRESLDKITNFEEKTKYGITLSKSYKCPKCNSEGKFKFEAWQIISFF